MESSNFTIGQMIIASGEKVNRLYVIYKGHVQQQLYDVAVTLGPGTIVGLTDAFHDTYHSSYMAMEDVTVFECQYSSVDDFHNIFEKEPVYIFGFTKGAYRQCRDIFALYDAKVNEAEKFCESVHRLYDEYVEICKSYGTIPDRPEIITNLRPPAVGSPIEKWESDYIRSFNEIDNKEIENIYGSREEIAIGVIGTCCGYIERATAAIITAMDYMQDFCVALMSEAGNDMFEMLFRLRIFAEERGLDISPIQRILDSVVNYIQNSEYYDMHSVRERIGEYNTFDYEAVRAQHLRNEEKTRSDFADCFGHICSFAGFDLTETEELRSDYKAVHEYASQSDSQDDEYRAIRRKWADDYYRIYKKVFFNAMEFEQDVTPIIRMFLNLGFVDTDQLQEAMVKNLLDLSDRLYLISDEHVFTIFGWLKAVYSGEKEPSRNEMDLDYRGYIIEERKAGNIQEKEVNSYMNDLVKKTEFEISNFFRITGRLTSGKMASFCPGLTDEDFGADFSRMLVTLEKLYAAIEKIEDVDFGLFYRDFYFTDRDIKNEPYSKRVGPDIILLPNSGSRAMMWQEIGGAQLDTPCRMVFPMYTLDDLDKMMIYCCGVFRWEICRKTNGLRWNEIGAGCLTSDFFDYFTYYKKNKDISTENKEKIKNLLKSSRNSMKEAFAKQYAIWITYESKGSMRLNKVERDLFGKHCTFSKKYRNPLADHPMYEKSIGLYKVKVQQKLIHMHAVFDKYQKKNGELPQDIIDAYDFLEK